MKRTIDNQVAISRYVIEESKTIGEALRRLNLLSGEGLTLFAVSPSEELQGTVTDGDIRRAIVGGAELSERVGNVMCRKFIAATDEKEVWVKIREGREKGIGLLPVLEDGRITEIINLKAFKTRLPLDAVLVAGGRGERLRPLTDNTPKPLLPIGEKAIIDYNVERLEDCGIENIFVTVNYLAEKIEEHFNVRANRSEIVCIKEEARTGTLGSLSLIEDLKHDDVLVMNSDLLTDIDFERFYEQHSDHGADLSVAVIPYSVSVPFAIMKMEDERVVALEEKPVYNYFANAGVYIIKRELIEKIERGSYLDAPDFITEAISSGKKVESFVIEGTWIDIGSPDEYRRAARLMERESRHLFR